MEIAPHDYQNLLAYMVIITKNKYSQKYQPAYVL